MAHDAPDFGGTPGQSAPGCMTTSRFFTRRANDAMICIWPSTCCLRTLVSSRLSLSSWARLSMSSRRAAYSTSFAPSLSPAAAEAGRASTEAGEGHATAAAALAFGGSIMQSDSFALSKGCVASTPAFTGSVPPVPPPPAACAPLASRIQRGAVIALQQTRTQKSDAVNTNTADCGPSAQACDADVERKSPNRTA